MDSVPMSPAHGPQLSLPLVPTSRAGVGVPTAGPFTTAKASSGQEKEREPG